ncbi:MAG: F0F1 ATP synthase subunit B [candidate division Zixibacteria bacterium]|jgi:F-type H+-transporting ATPase subunit b|nr:F0F1 ATP synthase subunit B [candidate division Zixibacteria bacterium]
MSDIVTSLGIKLPELLTQIVGFLLAVWILKLFAWKPLLAMLEQRRARIKADLDEAELAKKQANEMMAEYQRQLKEIDQAARAKIQEAIAEGNRVAAEIREQSRAEAKDIIGKAREDLTRDIAKAKVQLRNDIVNMAVLATEKVIAEKLTDDKHRQLINKFLDDIEQIK